jgi:hypothetical protein
MGAAVDGDERRDGQCWALIVMNQVADPRWEGRRDGPAVDGDERHNGQ